MRKHISNIGFQHLSDLDVPLITAPRDQSGMKSQGPHAVVDKGHFLAYFSMSEVANLNIQSSTEHAKVIPQVFIELYCHCIEIILSERTYQLKADTQEFFIISITQLT